MLQNRGQAVIRQELALFRRLPFLGCARRGRPMLGRPMLGLSPLAFECRLGHLVLSLSGDR
jgi:hypothetical protein